MRLLWLVPFLLAGCADPAEMSTGLAPADECDYELDDYAAVGDFLQVHWDVAGHGRDMSGIPFQVTLLQGQSRIVGQSTTQTDCVLFDMTGGQSDVVQVYGDRAEGCAWAASQPYAYRGGFDTVRIDLHIDCE